MVKSVSVFGRVVKAGLFLALAIVGFFVGRLYACGTAGCVLGCHLSNQWSDQVAANSWQTAIYYNDDGVIALGPVCASEPSMGNPVVSLLEPTHYVAYIGDVPPCGNEPLHALTPGTAPTDDVPLAEGDDNYWVYCDGNGS
jgi:hypothetical protein